MEETVVAYEDQLRCVKQAWGCICLRKNLFKRVYEIRLKYTLHSVFCGYAKCFRVFAGKV